MPNLVLLILACLLAVARPLWGIALLLILQCSIFSLGRFATVSLGIGYAGPGDVLVFCILLGALWQWRFRTRQYQLRFLNPYNKISPNQTPAFHRLRYGKFILVSAVLPYVIWQALCILRGIFIWQDTEFWNLTIRYLLSGIMPWSLALSVYLLRDRARDIIRITIIVASVTALLHTIILTLDIRPLMYGAYWDMSLVQTRQSQYFEDYFEQSDIVRSLPQGIYLMLFCLIYCFSRYFTESSKSSSRFYYLALSLLQMIAIAITYTRSLMAYIVAGCLITVFFSLILRLSPVRTLTRTAFSVAIVVLSAALVAAVNPRFMNMWTERIENITQDARIFSEDTNRGMDNIAAMSVIRDYPILGYGIPRYTEKYSLREVPGSDIHPLLMVGLVGGVLGIMLVVRLHFVLLVRLFTACRGNKIISRSLLPYLSIFALTFFINTSGAGGTLIGKHIFSMVLFTGLAVTELTHPFYISQSDTRLAAIFYENSWLSRSGNKIKGINLPGPKAFPI